MRQYNRQLYRKAIVLTFVIVIVCVTCVLSFLSLTGTDKTITILTACGVLSGVIAICRAIISSSGASYRLQTVLLMDREWQELHRSKIDSEVERMKSTVLTITGIEPLTDTVVFTVKIDAEELDLTVARGRITSHVSDKPTLMFTQPFLVTSLYEENAGQAQVPLVISWGFNIEVGLSDPKRQLAVPRVNTLTMSVT